MDRHASKLDSINGFISENLNQKNHIEKLVEQEEKSIELVDSLTPMLNNFMKKSGESSLYINISIKAY